MASFVGQTVSHYRILEQIGSGGMGVVYKAQDLTLDRTVALKFLHPVLSSSPDCKSRFLREARAASSLDHPNICTVFEVGETQDEQMFLSMAHYEGVTLKEKIDLGPLAFDEAISIGVQVAMGLQAAHERGIVHRDIKSGNIMLASGGRVKIMDFGLAKFSGPTQITGGYAQMGTLAFMSPEQARGLEADHRSDIWSLGVILYHMLTGRLPFMSEFDQALVYSILNQAAERPGKLRPDIPGRLEGVILRCLQKNPADRYQSAGEVMDALLQISQTSSSQSIARHAANVRKWLVAGSVLVPVLIGLAVVGRTSLRHRPPEENAVVVDVSGIGRQGSETQDPTPEMVEFLISDEVLQSTSKEVFRRDEFQRLHPGKVSAVDLGVSVESQDVGYNVKVTVEKPEADGPAEMSFQVNDRSALLTQVLPEIRRRLITAGALGNWKQSTFTQNWDAFVRFYYGNRAWTRLEIPKAKEHLNAAVAIDPQFVLAKLRLAEACNFEGSTVLARSFLRTVFPALGLLSKIDSLRARALDARIAREYRKEVAIRRDIYQLYPLRKEVAYDVAEAYYQLCEIPDAIAYYKIAIGLDAEFARAYNHLGYCYSHLGQHDSACTVIGRYLRLDSTANAFDSMGDCYMAAGYLDTAAWAKERGIGIDPELSYLYWSLMFIRLRQGRIRDADSAAARYLQYVFTPELKARGYTYKAFVAQERGDYRGAMKYCRQALETYDAPVLESRYPELHWLHALIGLQLNDPGTALGEMREMERLLREHNINATNYQMYFYKYYRHLQACLAARRNDITGVIDVARELDGPLLYKVKDWSSPFDYAFLSTALGELFVSPPLNRDDFATERFRLALQYNPRYAPAHHNLWKLHEKRGEKEKAESELRIVRQLWKDADPEFKKAHDIPL